MVAHNTAMLHIEGMNSGDSVREVAEALLGVEGVRDVEVDPETCRARVELDEQEPAPQDELIKAVSQTGCRVGRIETAPVE